jgi:hypothetical protein
VIVVVVLERRGLGRVGAGVGWWARDHCGGRFLVGDGLVVLTTGLDLVMASLSALLDRLQNLARRGGGHHLDDGLSLLLLCLIFRGHRPSPLPPLFVSPLSNSGYSEWISWYKVAQPL